MTHVQQNMADSAVRSGRIQSAFGPCFVLFWGKPRKVDSPKKKKVEKPQDGRQKSSQNIGNPYQMEDNKAAPSAPPQGGGASRRPLGVLVVFHLVRISYVFGAFPGPCWTPTAPDPPWKLRLPWKLRPPHLYSGLYSSFLLKKATASVF